MDFMSALQVDMQRRVTILRQVFIINVLEIDDKKSASLSSLPFISIGHRTENLLKFWLFFN